MRIRHNAYVGNGADRRRTYTSRTELAALTLSSSSEQLDYIAAMDQELKIMSAQAGYRALAGLLEQAYHEAMRQRRADE